MFETLEEAQETNSECAFCDKPKFIAVEDVLLGFHLVRCSAADCDLHCKWDHSGVVMQIQLGGPDVLSIASGWGA